MAETLESTRNAARAPIELKVEYKKMNAFFADYTRNISKGGTFIETRHPLDLGTVFVFKLHVPNREEPYTLKGEVMWSNNEVKRMRPEMSQFGMGIRFLFDDDHQRQEFQTQVEDLMLDALGELVYRKLVKVAQRTTSAN